MQQKKRILLLATGGTIASRKSDNGLKPQITPEELIEYIPQVKEILSLIHIFHGKLRPMN